MKWNEVTWYSKLGALILFLVVVPILCFYIGEKYEEVKSLQEYKKPLNISEFNNNNETKNFRIYRKHDGYVYLVGPEYPVVVYYKSNEVNKFENYNELDYVQITANSFTKLSNPEKEFVGIKNYTVDITQEINNITSIKPISEAEFDPIH